MNGDSSERESLLTKDEQFYDSEIAPKLRELCEACKARGLSFLAVVEYAPGEHGRTFWRSDSAGIGMVMSQHCAATAPNIDGYVIGLARYCNERGIDTSGSIVMRMMKGDL